MKPPIYVGSRKWLLCTLRIQCGLRNQKWLLTGRRVLYFQDNEKNKKIENYKSFSLEVILKSM